MPTYQITYWDMNLSLSNTIPYYLLWQVDLSLIGKSLDFYPQNASVFKLSQLLDRPVVSFYVKFALARKFAYGF